jgi:glycosyltransferase A (GT-A) superfamily protein (DUF2064 family)
MIPRLYIMTKAPIMGRAKTRLAADIGVVHAKRHYRAMMVRVIRQVQDPRWETVLSVTPASSVGQVPEWYGLPQIPQVSGSLSPRLADLFKGKGPTIVIGTDCPQVTARDIAEGFRALKSHNEVFGPATDGGFWLMGANGPLPPSMFDNIQWSHKDTLSDIADKTDGAFGVLRTLTDIDDLKALQESRSL